MKRARAGIGVWIVLGLIGWTGLVFIGWSLWTLDPPRAGFDLALPLDGARAVAAGQSPYDPVMLAGGSPAAAELFYSYPPPVAQAMQLVAWLPDGVVLMLWGLGATLGMGHIGAEIARRDRQGEPRSTVLGGKAILAAPLFLPFAVALLFGNLDAWYPLLYSTLVPRIASPVTTAAMSTVRHGPSRSANTRTRSHRPRTAGWSFAIVTTATAAPATSHVQRPLVANAARTSAP